jgi:chromosome segregation ATPase
MAQDLDGRLAAARESVASLERRRTAAEAELGRLTRAKAPIVLSAAEGDAKQQRHLAQLNERIAAQRQVVDDIGLAILRAREQAQGIEREIEQAGEAAKADRLEGWHAEAIRIAGEVDRNLAEDAALFGELEACLNEMAACAPVELRDVLRIGIPTSLVRGALHAGSSGRMPFQHP